jgi:uncharacterized protein YsxB (DUF464 family)
MYEGSEGTSRNAYRVIHDNSILMYRASGYADASTHQNGGALHRYVMTKVTNRTSLVCSNISASA